MASNYLRFDKTKGQSIDFVSTPSTDVHIANKKYVDDQLTISQIDPVITGTTTTDDLVVNNDITAGGDFTVAGSFFTNKTELLFTNSNWVHVNDCHIDGDPQVGGWTFIGNSTGLQSNITAFTAGVAATSNPIISVDSEVGWAPNMIAKICDANTTSNDLYVEILAVGAGTLTIKGVGLTDTTDEVFSRDVVTDATPGGTITQVNLLITRLTTGGEYESSDIVNTTPINYYSIAGTQIQTNNIIEKTPGAGVNVSGILIKNDYLELTDIPTPSNTSDGKGLVYKKTADDGLYWLPDSAGAEVDLTAVGFVGPVSSTDNAVVRFDGTGGNTAQDSLVSISDTGVITVPAATGLFFTGATKTLSFYDEWQQNVTFTGGTGWSQTVSVRITRCGDLLQARIGGDSDTQTTVSTISTATGVIPLEFRPGSDTCVPFIVAVGGNGQIAQLDMDNNGSITIGEVDALGSTNPDPFPADSVGWATQAFSYHKV